MIDSENLKKYIELHKNGREVVGALLFAFGEEETRKIINEALENHQKVFLTTYKDKLDALTFTLRKIK